MKCVTSIYYANVAALLTKLKPECDGVGVGGMNNLCSLGLCVMDVMVWSAEVNT